MGSSPAQGSIQLGVKVIDNTIKINIPIEDRKYPIRDKAIMVYASWDFTQTEYYKWLELNCPNNYQWNWGDELTDGTMSVIVYFDNSKHFQLFQNEFKQKLCNLEEYIDKDIDKQRSENISYQYCFTPWPSLDVIHQKELNKIVFWCRQNFEDEWYVLEDVRNIYFCVKSEKDAAAFRLRWD